MAFAGSSGQEFCKILLAPQKKNQSKFFKSQIPSLVMLGGKKTVLEKQARAPKGPPEFCGTFGDLQEGSAERFT